MDLNQKVKNLPVPLYTSLHQITFSQDTHGSCHQYGTWLVFSLRDESLQITLFEGSLSLIQNMYVKADIRELTQ